MHSLPLEPALPAAAEAPVVGTPAFSPLYRQIKALIVRSLQAGEWRPGEAIPSETELSARFKVSHGTVRKAIDELAADNLLLRRQGKGTFVATHAEQTVQYRFLRLAGDVDGLPATGGERRVIDCRPARAPADVARTLQIGSGEPVVRVQRLLAFGGRPVVHDDIWLPGALFGALTLGRLQGWGGPLYVLFEAEFGVRMIRADERIRAVAAEADVARWLDVPEGAPLLGVERLSMTYGNQPVELRRGSYHTVNHHYRNVLG